LRRRLSRALLAGGLGLFAILFLLGLDSRDPATFAQGEPLPAFDLERLDGGRLTNADVAGRVMVINVWAAWCPPCRAEAPVLKRVEVAADSERVAFLGVARDNDPDESRDFLEDHGITFLNATGDGSFARALRVSGLPTTFVVDASGDIVARHFGPISESKLTVLIADALARGEAATE
jgi:cytochrome c biogenesis protein CcmG/thiol:disulfide interchange protein DsbE